MKSYTDLEQSKKLTEILPRERADMVLLHEEPYETSDSKFDGLHQALCVSFCQYDKSWRQKYRNISYFPCWSLAALLNYIKDKCGYFELVYLNSTFDGRANKLENVYRLSTDVYDIYEKEAVDACVEMILKLNELKLL